MPTLYFEYVGPPTRSRSRIFGNTGKLSLVATPVRECVGCKRNDTSHGANISFDVGDDFVSAKRNLRSRSSPVCRFLFHVSIFGDASSATECYRVLRKREKYRGKYRWANLIKTSHRIKDATLTGSRANGREILRCNELETPRTIFVLATLRSRQFFSVK